MNRSNELSSHVSLADREVNLRKLESSTLFFRSVVFFFIFLCVVLAWISTQPSARLELVDGTEVMTAPSAYLADAVFSAIGATLSFVVIHKFFTSRQRKRLELDIQQRDAENEIKKEEERMKEIEKAKASGAFDRFGNDKP